MVFLILNTLFNPATFKISIMSLSSKSNDSTFDRTKTRYIFIALILFYLIFSFIYGVLVGFFPGIPDFEDPIVNQILYICSFGSLCYYLWKKLRQSRLNPQYLIGNKFPRYRWWSLLGLAIILLLFSVGAALLSFYALSLVAPNFMESFMESLAEQESKVSSLPTVDKCLETINYIVVAPITEEFVFRGVLLHRLATKWNIAIAIWISSIIFGLMHPNPVGISMLGVVWALLYIKTKTLIVPIVAHAINNTIVVVWQFLGTFVENNGSITEATEISSQDWIIGLLLVAVSLPFLIRFIYRRFPAKSQTLPYFANEAEAIAEIPE